MARILIVDDQKISRLTLANILGEARHEVRAEASGPAGLEAAREWLPDVIVLDVHMPEMDGFEVVARLKEDSRTESIPVVFLTGEPPTDDLIVRGLELGAYDFLSKGGSKAELLARVGVMARIKRSHDELAAIARISDALLRSLEPRSIARQFVHEARQVFRADVAMLSHEQNGRSRLMVCDGLPADERLGPLLEAVVGIIDTPDPATAVVLSSDDVNHFVRPVVSRKVGGAAFARVRRGNASSLVVVMTERADGLRPELDAPLLRNLSSQASIAIEHALLNQRARRQARDLEKAMTERSRFFASLSHELRTPINAVIGYNHLLQEQIFGELSDQQMDALGKASRSAEHLLELVDDILDISKIEAGKLEVFPEPVDLPALIQDTATTVQLQARDKGIGLDIDVESDLTITTDPARLRQILLNLLSNAVKFTDEGGVTLSLDPADHGVTIKVRDSGSGIPKEDLDRIFEEFEQVGTAGKGGTGLGLSISRRLAELLGGSLSAESTPGEGSTFTLKLPREWQGPQKESDLTREVREQEPA
ncbi:MAG TPA: hybrid sensor histidine kinase/response regulator [Longimicrobiales bacterium]|nr:hybrid sensor histidine kinase/response regulator [Longimicrobiales bacterium]